MDIVLFIAAISVLGSVCTIALSAALFYWLTRNGQVLYLRDAEDLQRIVRSCIRRKPGDRSRRYVDALKRCGSPAARSRDIEYWHEDRTPGSTPGQEVRHAG
jgi:hypothetical protein